MTFVRRIAALESALLRPASPGQAEAERLLIGRWQTIFDSMDEEDIALVLSDLASLAPTGRCCDHPDETIRVLAATVGWEYQHEQRAHRLTWAAVDQAFFPQVHFVVGLPPAVAAIYHEHADAKASGFQCELCGYAVPSHDGVDWHVSPSGSLPYLAACPMPDCGGVVAYNGWSKKHGSEAWRVRRDAGAALNLRFLRILGPPQWQREWESRRRAAGSR